MHRKISDRTVTGTEVQDVRKYFGKYGHLYIVMFISAAIFIAVYGVSVLNVTHTDWLLAGGDLSQHYLGWKFFRNAPWQEFIGMMNNVAYPFSESVIFTDSIPLMAVLCKLVRDVLPVQFQYFGIWGLLCFVLQGLCVALILQKYLRFENGAIHRVQVVIGSLFFVLAPVMLRRMFWHTSLAAHWIILLSLLFYVYHDEWFEQSWKCVIAWGLLGVLCASVHIYYIPMCGVVLLGFLALDYAKNKRLRRLPMPLVAYIFGAFFTIWILGGFSSDMLDGAPGLGYYSFNLNGFFSPQEWSAFFPDIKNYADGQYEGFAYLGIGMLLLVAVSIVYSVLYVWRKKKKEQQEKIPAKYIITVVMIALSILMSASNELSFGKYLICKIPLPDKIESLWAIFRASGRLIWPAVYLLMLYGICMGARAFERWDKQVDTKLLRLQNRQVIWTVIMTGCCVLQILELRPQLVAKHDEFSRDVTYVSELQDAFWTSILPGMDVNAMVFADKNELSQEALYAFADYASDYQMTINDFYFARALSYSTEEVAEDFLEHSNDHTIYIFTWGNRHKCAEYDLHYYIVDDYVIGLKSPLPTRTEAVL